MRTRVSLGQDIGTAGRWKGGAIRNRGLMFLAAAVLAGLPTPAKAGLNLIKNPSNEMALDGGNIPDWTEDVGSNWIQRGSDPDPYDGNYYFCADAVSPAGLAQVVDVSGLATTIDAGLQVFDFQGYVRTYPQYPADVSRIIVEYRDASDTVLYSFDSHDIASVGGWLPVTDSRIAPAGTRDINVRLISTRYSGNNNDGYYDALSLETHVVPIPGAVVLGGMGLSFAGWLCRRRVA
jgi:hypothetical protein